MHAPHVVGSESSGHGFDALSFTRQQQTRAVVLQRDVSVSMPCRFRQALDMPQSVVPVEPGEDDLLTKQFYSKLFVYNTVVLGSGRQPCASDLSSSHN